MIRVRLDEQDFRDLVRGRVVKVITSDEERPAAEIALADIGFERMALILYEALNEALKGDGIPRARGEDR